MKRLRLMLALLLAAICSHAMADWTLYGTGDEGNNSYLNISTIKKAGNKIKIWGLTDYKNLQVVKSSQFFSEVSLREYDCKAETIKFLAVTTYLEHMAVGKVIYTFNMPDSEEMPIAPDTLSADGMKLACSKKYK